MQNLCDPHCKEQCIAGVLLMRTLQQQQLAEGSVWCCHQAQHAQRAQHSQQSPGSGDRDQRSPCGAPSWPKPACLALLCHALLNAGLTYAHHLCKTN